MRTSLVTSYVLNPEPDYRHGCTCPPGSPGLHAAELGRMPVFKHRPGALPRRSSQPLTEQLLEPAGRPSPFAAQAGGHAPTPAPAVQPPPHAGPLPAAPRGAQEPPGSPQAPGPQAATPGSSGPSNKHRGTPQEGQPLVQAPSSKAALAPADHEPSPSAAHPHPHPNPGRSQGPSHLPTMQGTGAASGQGPSLGPQHSGSSSVAAKSAAGARQDTQGATSGSPAGPVPGGPQSRRTCAEAAAGQQAEEVSILTGTPPQRSQAGGRAARDQAGASQRLGDGRPILSGIGPASPQDQPGASEPLPPLSQQPTEAPVLSGHARDMAAYNQPDDVPILTGRPWVVPPEERVGSETSSTQAGSPPGQPEGAGRSSAASSEAGRPAPQPGPLSAYRLSQSEASDPLVHLPRLGRASIVGDEPLEGPLPLEQNHILVRQYTAGPPRPPLSCTCCHGRNRCQKAWCSSTCLMPWMPVSHDKAQQGCSCALLLMCCQQGSAAVWIPADCPAGMRGFCPPPLRTKA